MGMKILAKKALGGLSDGYYKAVIKKAELDKISNKKKLWSSVSLTPEQETAVKEIYGNKADFRWHRYYQYFTGRFDAKYMPELLFSTQLELVLNPRSIAREMEDKARIPIIYSGGGIALPKTILTNCSGIAYDSDGNILSSDMVNKTVKCAAKEFEKLIIKPTRGSCSGNNVYVLTEKNYREILLRFSQNYIVQEMVENQDDIKRLNPASLNTMRVITYICDDQYFCAPILLRIGASDSHLDNAHAGGIFVGVNRDGTLCPEAYAEYGEKYTEHPISGIRFDGYRIRNIEKVVSAALICHKKTPHMRMVSWDITLDKDENAILIEANLFGQSVWLPQIAHGCSLFGEHTERMLELLHH